MTQMGSNPYQTKAPSSQAKPRPAQFHRKLNQVSSFEDLSQGAQDQSDEE